MGSEGRLKQDDEIKLKIFLLPTQVHNLLLLQNLTALKSSKHLSPLENSFFKKRVKAAPKKPNFSSPRWLPLRLCGCLFFNICIRKLLIVYSNKHWLLGEVFNCARELAGGWGVACRVWGKINIYLIWIIFNDARGKEDASMYHFKRFLRSAEFLPTAVSRRIKICCSAKNV